MKVGEYATMNVFVLLQDKSTIIKRIAVKEF